MSNDPFALSDFPRSATYNPEWIRASVSGGANPLWLTEWLAESLRLEPGMKVLDLGCGRGMSSIFLQKEFGVKVWACDLLVSASENYQRIFDAGVEENVYPLRVDARSLPFAADYFDVIISIDSFFYYGTDDLYLGNILRFLKPGGKLAIAGAGIMNEMNGAVPKHLQKWWTPDVWCLHSAEWWRQHWNRTGFVDIEVADSMNDGWKKWLSWHQAIVPDNRLEIEALEADEGSWLGYVRVIASKRTGLALEEPVTSIPANYEAKQLLRK